MIRHSFCFLKKVGRKKEQRLWDAGIYSWESFLTRSSIKGISQTAKAQFDRQLKEARRELYSENSSYFAKLLPISEHWRLYDFFKEDCAYLDIESDGVKFSDDITVVGLYDGIDTKTMIRGVNLDFHALKKELSRYKMIVTFNGSVFDVPFIKKRYGNIIPDIPHFDLRFSCKRIGLQGGLKEIERTMGIRRRDIVQNMYGGDAAVLHRMWRGSGDEHYLQLLVEYNEEDVINLKQIAEHVYANLRKQVGF